MRVALALYLAFVASAGVGGGARTTPLRHMEYLVTNASAGQTAHSKVALDLLDRSAEGVTVGLVQDGASVVLDLDKHGTMTSSDLVTMSPEATLLAYFFSLGSVNLTGMDAGERWSADGTDYHALEANGGMLVVEFSRPADPVDGGSAYRGRLRYDVQKVVPVSFAADADVPLESDGSAARHVHVTAKLISDSQLSSARPPVRFAARKPQVYERLITLIRRFHGSTQAEVGNSKVRRTQKGRRSQEG